MNIGIWPFYSQKDTTTGMFQLDTCGATKQMDFLARQMADAKHRVSVVLPVPTPLYFRGCRKVIGYTPLHNPTQRVHWDTNVLREAFQGCEAVVCNHEYGSIPLRAMGIGGKLIQMCAVAPDNPLFYAAWGAADSILVHTACMAGTVRAVGTGKRIVIAPMRYDADKLRTDDNGVRPIDVLFLQRCSVTNYTRHEEFLKAMPEMRGAVTFVDVTKYLRSLLPYLNYSTHVSYNSDLLRAKLATAFNDDNFGGQAIVEAIACGCIPILLDAPCYRELVRDHPGGWPYFVKKDMSNVAEVVNRALQEYGTVDTSAIRRCALDMSYQKAWPIVEQLL